jgi:uncharacterized protein
MPPTGTDVERLHPYQAVGPSMRQEILKRLDTAENEHGVRILYACESGSRAWGFPSPDSDYDVRFIYARDVDWYLAYDVERRRDVVEYPIVDEIDIGGWDIRKACELFTRSNGALLEWLRSPIVYVERGGFASGLRALESKVVNPIALCYHYSHIARHNASACLESEAVKLKRYFYALRPLLATRYVEQHQVTPPMVFQNLVDAVAPPEVRQEIADLVRQKRETPELGFGEPVPMLNAFIEAELERHGSSFGGLGRPEPAILSEVRTRLNRLFLETVQARPT